MKPKPGDTVMLTEVPPGMLDDLPADDQQAINEVVGKPIVLNAYDDAGRAELEFKDRNGDFHWYLRKPGIPSVRVALQAVTIIEKLKRDPV